MRFMRALLRGGELDGARVLRPETVALAFSDRLDGAVLPDGMHAAIPELSNDVPAFPFTEGWGLGFRLVLEDMPAMRRAGTADWGGLFNCNYWIDRTAGIAGALLTQVLPFYDAQIVEAAAAFEQGVYAEVGAPQHA
jgi:CubicO group peptidase (beta-lactamase class C family)